MRAVIIPSASVFAFGCVVAAIVSHAAEQAGSPHEISIRWRLVENLPDNRYRAQLTLRNDSNNPLPGPWTLYFNSSSRLLPESVNKPLRLRHINGDFYALTSGKEFAPLEAGNQLDIDYMGVPWAINVSDAPCGFYFVFEDGQGNERSPVAVPLEIAPFPESSVIRRGASDRLPVVTPESRFRQNEKLTVLSASELPPVVPTPIRVTTLADRVAIGPSTKIVCESDLDSEAAFLATALRQAFDIEAEVIRQPIRHQDSIQLRRGPVEIAGVTKKSGDEAYRLTARPDAGIEIVGTDPAGVFYGIETLRALLPLENYQRRDGEIAIDAVQIEDAPRFPYRGVHLDVARNFQSVDTVKRLLDLMAFYKLNRFHWHLTDDEGWRIEIKALPELTSVGGHRGHTTNESDHLIPSLGSGPSPDPDRSPGSGFYTQDELVDILRYAQERHIQVIPELDFPGHSRAAIKAMAARSSGRVGSDPSADHGDFRLTNPDDKSKYESVQMWRDNVIDVCQQSTYDFLDLVVTELADVYRRAGSRLECVHVGGDEVPKGAWENSPACRTTAVGDGPLTRGQRLELYFLKRSSDLLAQHKIATACWEDCPLLATELPAESRAAIVGEWSSRPTAYVWNNVWGWGREDAAYKLANAGYDVVLANATHLYFDFAYEKHPNEPGYYWAGFVDTRAPFEFNPFDVFQNARANSMGEPLTATQFADRTRLSDDGKKHILGIQGQLWGENLRSAETLEYMAFPRLISLAERAWAAEPTWSSMADPAARDAALAQDWNRFANCLGQRELPRLNYLVARGVNYRLPPAGVIVRDQVASANVAFPGLIIRYSTDGKEPAPTSPVFRDATAPNDLRLRVFDTSGRGSRTENVGKPQRE